MQPTRMVYLGAGLAALALMLTLALVVWLRAADRTSVRADAKVPPPGRQPRSASVRAAAQDPLLVANLATHPPVLRADANNTRCPGAKLSPAPAPPADTVTKIESKSLQPRTEGFRPRRSQRPREALGLCRRQGPSQARRQARHSASPEIEGKNLRQWTAELGNEDPSVREEGYPRRFILFGSQSATSSVIDALIARCTSDPEASPRVRAVIALTVLDIPEPDHRKVIDALAKCLDGHLGGWPDCFRQRPAGGRPLLHAAVALKSASATRRSPLFRG